MRNIVLAVTPARNAEEYIEQTILSVLQQRGDFDVHYHLQDGGSTDATLDIVRQWEARLRESGGRWYGGAPVRLTWHCAPDRSMYEAIQTGFDRLLESTAPGRHPLAVMTWINADDVLSAGAFGTAASYLATNPDRPWVTGIPSLILEDGTIVDVRDSYAYSQQDLARGLCDGRSRAFLQQEGTFWTAALWSRVGGLNPHLRLAGDWDLWRRMARQTSVVTLRAVLAHHRRRRGQLSEDMSRYWREVDALTQSEPPVAAPPGRDDVGWVAGWNASELRWKTYPSRTAPTHSAGGPEQRQGVMRLDMSASDTPLWVRDVSGLSSPESWGRWSDARLAPSVRVSLAAPIGTPASLRVRLAVVDRRCNPVIVTVGLRRFELEVSAEASDFVLVLPAGLEISTIDLRASASFEPKAMGWSDDPRHLGIAVSVLEVVRDEPS